MTNALSPENNPRTREIGESLGPTAGLTLIGKDQNLLPLPRMEPRHLSCSARRLKAILYDLSRIPTIFVLLFKLICSSN